MKIEDIIAKMDSNKHLLPIVAAFQEIAPYRKNSIDALQKEKLRTAAVMLLLFPENGDISTILIHRATYKGVHSNQIGFPGGKYEEKDDDLKQTALRETQEEIGIVPEKIQIIGQLSNVYIPVSNIQLMPFVGFTNEKPAIILDKREVAGYFFLSINELIKENIIQERMVRASSELRIKVPCFVVEENIVWGATAMILNEFRYLIK